MYQIGMFCFLGSYVAWGIFWLRLVLIAAHSCMVAWAVAFTPGYLGGIAFDTLIWNGV